METPLTIGALEGTGDRPKKRIKAGVSTAAESAARAKANRHIASERSRNQRLSKIATKRPYTRHIPAGVDAATLKPTKTYGITRVEQETKYNYGFKVCVGPPGSRSNLWFADQKCGGKAKALKAATAKRDELVEKLPLWYKIRASKKRRKAS